MSERDNGGSAFPMIETSWNHDYSAREVSSYGGMSLRDYFAAKAMLGIYTMVAGRAHDVSASAPEDDIARLSYRMADAMLKARQS